MKASFQRADLFVFTDFVGDLFPLLPDAKIRKNIPQNLICGNLADY